VFPTTVYISLKTMSDYLQTSTTKSKAVSAYPNFKPELTQ
jgi:hypothetical protein